MGSAPDAGRERSMPEENSRQAVAAPRASRPYMPGYGLPEGAEGLLPWSWAETRLASSHVYWLATTRADGRPHLMPVWGLWLEGALHFSTGRQSRKARNLDSNANCAIATDQAREAVVVEGIALEVMDVGLRKRFLSLYQAKYQYDMSSMESDILSLREPIYAVQPRTAFGLDEEASLHSATRWRFP
jgi:hypothetical protein